MKSIKIASFTLLLAVASAQYVRYPQRRYPFYLRALKCKDGDFKCSVGGKCVSYMQRCDLHEDCPDGEDEKGCTSARVCSSDQFSCQDLSLCIPKASVCDGRSDCQDNSDELDCQRDCSNTEFKCSNGDCIPSNLWCDGKADCQDRSDEANCQRQCKTNEWKCNDGNCISLLLKCDRHTDCLDGSDEHNCTCPDDWFKCKNSYCIPKEKRCDGQTDCNDMSDETDCDDVVTKPVCQLGQTLCVSEDRCFNAEDRCNGRFDCLDGSDEKNCCRSDEFTCADGTCIRDVLRCNGHRDCIHGDDEQGCPGVCRDSEFRCSNGECIPSDSQCNGTSECQDSSDEDGCDERPVPCLTDEFRCRNGVCISRDFYCDDVKDCTDGSDEDNCEERPCGPEDFRCNSDNKCINPSQLCDGIVHCQDGSDELVSNCRSCHATEFQCNDGECIPLDLKCNGNRDCRDGSDEMDCPVQPTPSYPVTPYYVNCSFTEFACRSGDRCIPYNLNCDGRFDCSDHSDEENCTRGPRPELRIYEGDQIIKETREAVFRCRDEGVGRHQVRWSRDRLPLPPGSRDYNGRLEIPNVQREHSGTYYCEAVGVSPNTIGARVSVQLTVEQLLLPTHAPFPSACGPGEATCYNRQCIPKHLVCNGHHDCGDGSDETRCHNLQQRCEPNEFHCNNGKCVLKSWRCDKDNDCEDGSDELGCDIIKPGTGCNKNEFECSSKNQCIPRNFHCDKINDCQDGSDEIGCFKMEPVEKPPPFLNLSQGETMTLTCRFIGVPIPIISWRWNWKNVPSKCSMSSVDGTGTLTCPDMQQQDSGAYSCEAISPTSYILVDQDTIVLVGTDSCRDGTFNELAKSQDECIKCFCFGVSESIKCESANLFVYQLPPPTRIFRFLNVYISPDWMDVRVVHDDYSLQSQFKSISDGFRIQSQSNNIESRAYPYYLLPESESLYSGNMLKSYAGYLSYQVMVDNLDRQLQIPDIIITGNGQILLYKHPYPIQENSFTTINVSISEGSGWEVLKPNETKYAARREDIMMTLVNVDKILIRTQYTTSQGVMTALANLTMDSASFSNTGLGKAAFVERCFCPTGYKGFSCEECDTGYERVVGSSPWLGYCVKSEVPIREPCPCPMTSPPNQFTNDCYRDRDNNITCRCPSGYSGRRCEMCDYGYEGDPLKAGGQCTKICNPAGTLTTFSRDDRCICKRNVVGPTCSECAPNSYYLHHSNKDGCINCFCMGITRNCNISRLYRDQISVTFGRDDQNVVLVPEDDITHPVQARVIPGSMELSFDQFHPQVYYWNLPSKFLGDQVKSYGGILEYRLRYVPTPGGQSSRNNAADIKLTSRAGVNLFYYGKINVEPDQVQTIQAPLLEQHWQLENGTSPDRENFLMALATLETISLKATFTTNTLFATLQHVSMDTASDYYTSRGIANSVEECRCPTGYRGTSCELCDAGFKRISMGSYLGLCSKCECNGRSDECNPETGDCYNCRDGWTGPRCNDCPPGYSIDDRQQCLPNNASCQCDPRGVLRPGYCPNGFCECKVNVIGEYCDRCRPRTFNLDMDNLLGCDECYCSGVSSSCQSSNLFYEPWPMVWLTEQPHDFILSDLNGNDVIRDGFKVNPSMNEIGYTFNSRQENYYWSLPHKFTGDKVTSYGGNLIYTQMYTSRGRNPEPNQDIILSGNGMSIYWRNEDLPRPNERKTFNIPIKQGKWRRLERETGHSEATRQEILKILSQLSSIKIRASFDRDTVDSFLSDVSLDVAIPRASGQAALAVEFCNCSSEYEGTSCQLCAKSHFKNYDNTCRPCRCNNREESCYLGSDNQLHCICREGWFGQACELGQCLTPNFLDCYNICERCPCRNREGSCYVGSIGRIICMCQTGYGGQYFQQDRCSGHYYRDNYGRCQRCPCNGRETSCKMVSNKISEVTCKCSGEFTGQFCEDCIQGYFKDKDNTCKKCPCDNQGSDCYLSDNYVVCVCQMISPDGSCAINNGTMVHITPGGTLYPRIGDSIQFRCNFSAPEEVFGQIELIYSTTTPVYHLSNYLSRKRYSGRGSVSETITVQPGLRRVECSIYNKRQRKVGLSIAEILIGERPEPNYRNTTTTEKIPITIELTIQEQDSSIQIKEVGSTVRYTCSVLRSRPDDGYVRLVWSKEGGELPYDRASDDRQGNLEIVDLKVSDSGIYVCTAESSMSSGSQQVTLRVGAFDPGIKDNKDQHQRPSVRIEPESVRVREGDAVEVVCYARGNPLPSIEWRRSDNRPLSPQTNIVYGTLRIPYTTRSDAGNYQCIASNVAGQDSRIISISVTDLPVPESFVSITPTSVTIVPGEVVTLNCNPGSSSSDYEIEWRRENNRPLPLHAIQMGSQLQLKRTYGDDAGIYICIVRSRATGRTIGQSTARITISTAREPIYPKYQKLPEGQTAEITCNAPSDVYSVEWYKYRGEIMPKVQFVNNRRMLRIPSLTMNDRGHYYCHYMHRDRPYNLSATVDVERREAPTIELYPEDRRQILSIGSDLHLDCRFTGYPEPTVTWTRADNRSFSENADLSHKGKLRLNRVHLSDTGDYICTAENVAGRISLTTHIEVQSPLEIRVYPRDYIELQAGQNLDLTCIAEGTPAPSVFWTKQDPSREIYTDYQSPGFAEPNLGRAEYQVLQVSSEDEGTYYCVARNWVKKEYKAVKVRVYDSAPPPPPPETPEEDSLWVALGSDTQVTCYDEVYRNLRSTWVRGDDAPFPPGVSTRDGTLYVRAATQQAEGEYVCLVYDEQGREMRRIGKYLQVKSLPEITLEPPKQIVRPGDNAQIYCSARGEEPIEVSWKANHTLSSHVHISGGLLSFQGITESDAGRYVCMARNKVGLRESAAEVIVNENSGYSPRVQVVGDRSRTVTQGAMLDLECRADMPGEVIWTKHDGSLASNVMKFGQILRVLNAEPYNSGRYVCTFQLPSGAVGSDYIDLTITRGRGSTCTGFQCLSGECIDKVYRCDNTTDCADSSDEIYCQRRRRGAHRGGLKIEPSIDIITVGSTVDLKCITEGIPSSSIVWDKLGQDNLGDNVLMISPSILRIADVTTSNAGTYRCYARTDLGTHTDDYTLNVQDDSQHSDDMDMDPTTIAPGPVAAKTVSLKLGHSADITCSNDLEPPVKYSWIRQGGLPPTATSEEGKLTLKKVTAKDSGLYTCVVTNGEVKMEFPTFIVVYGTIPRFTQTSQSYLKLKTLFDALMQFDIEILFKPEQPNGLLLFNGKRHPSASGASDFVSFGLRDGYPEFKFDVGSGHATIVGRTPLEMGKWVKTRLIRNRKEGRLIINDEEPVIGTSPGRHHSLDLDLPLYVGSVPDFNDIPKSVDYSTGFRGCIARLVIKNEEQTLTRAGALEWTGISECDTCAENTCTNSGACQEYPNLKGYLCLCPRGFSGENCDRTGESCYPGLCGEGFCQNTEKSYLCKCQLGLAGPNCEHRIHIRTPSFQDNAFIAYPTPRSTEKLDITLKLNPADSRDGLILYAAQNDIGSGNYLSLAIKDRRLEFRIETGFGAPIVVKSNSEVIPGSWMTVTAGRDAREARLSIGQDMARATLSSGQRRELILGTYLYLGGYHPSSGRVNPNVGVTDGFRGCISHIEVSRMDLDILKSSKESSNVRECPSGNPCRDSPCLNGATCQHEGGSYVCHCTPDFSGRHCDKYKNDCERYQPCGSKGECIPLSSGYRCNCAKGFSGQNCTMREHFTTSFSLDGNGWVELPKRVLADIGDETEVEMTLVTTGRDGVLMWHGQGPRFAGGDTDFFSIGVTEGRVKVIFELGSGLGEVISSRRIDDGLPHNIRVTRTGNLVRLSVDDESVDGQSGGFLSKLNAEGNVYIGGLPDARYMTNGRYTQNFNGCIKNLRIQNSDDIDISNAAVATVNVVKCPVNKWIPTSTRLIFTEGSVRPTIPGDWPYQEKSSSSFLPKISFLKLLLVYLTYRIYYFL